MQMHRVALVSLSLTILCTTGVLAAPKVAVVYSSWGNYSFRDEFDGHLQKLGWSFEKFENKDIATLIPRLSEFDIVLATAVSNYENTVDMTPFKDSWVQFLNRGGLLLITDASWEKGAIAVLKSAIWFVSQNKQVSVSLKEVTGMELTKREVNKKPTDVVKIDHLENSDVVTSFVLCPLSTLQILLNFLQDATKDLDMKGNELDPLAAQVERGQVADAQLQVRPLPQTGTGRLDHRRGAVDPDHPAVRQTLQQGGGDAAGAAAGVQHRLVAREREPVQYRQAHALHGRGDAVVGRAVPVACRGHGLYVITYKRM